MQSSAATDEESSLKIEARIRKKWLVSLFVRFGALFCINLALLALIGEEEAPTLFFK